MNALSRANELLHRALEHHELSGKNLSNDYQAVRRLRREGSKLWDEVRAHLAALSNPPPAPPPELPPQQPEDAGEPGTETHTPVASAAEAVGADSAPTAEAAPAAKPAKKGKKA